MRFKDPNPLLSARLLMRWVRTTRGNFLSYARESEVVGIFRFHQEASRSHTEHAAASSHCCCFDPYCSIYESLPCCSKHHGLLVRFGRAEGGLEKSQSMEASHPYCLSRPIRFADCFWLMRPLSLSFIALTETARHSSRLKC